MSLKSQIVALAFCLGVSLPIIGQEANTAISQINAIKKSGDYVYAEATMPEQEQAQDGAMALLKVGIGSWLQSSENPQGTFDLSILDSHVKVINAKRGSQHRVFVYISKSDLNERKEIDPNKGENESCAMNVQVIDLTDSTAIEAGVSVDEDVQPFQLDDVEKEMVRVKMFDEIKPFVEGLKAKGRLNRFGKYATLPSNGTFHLFIYSQTGDVVACLLKTDDGYFNLRTLTPDSIENYKKCGSIWLEIIK